MLSWGGDSRESWQLLALFCRACKVDIFETKDSLGKGVEHRLIKNWPIKIKRAHELEFIFRPFVTEQMQQQRQSTVALLF